MELIFIIIIAVFISAIKKGSEESAKATRRQNTWEQTVRQAPRQTVRTTPAREQMRQQNEQIRRQNEQVRKTTILERAVANAEEDKVDVTLETMEAEHNHSERVAPAIHHHPEDVLPESMLGSVDDLMVKGFDGNLCFERDFVGEAMDMINRFTVPSDLPEYDKDAVV